MNAIPVIDISALFDGPGGARDDTDRQIARAAFDIGFMTVTGHPAGLGVDAAARAVLLKLFDIPQDRQRPYWKRNFAPENANLYRGWFPLSSGVAGTREGFEIGPDIVRSLPEDGADDLLYEPTPLPQGDLLPDTWRDVAARYYLGMEEIGHRLLASLSRGLGIDEAIFRDAFDDGISTLRLLHYLPGRARADVDDRLADRFREIDGALFELVAGEHIDSGLLTVLAQCGVPGLQAQAADGSWVDVPVLEDGFAVNFGGLLECWTGGRVRATRHRVVGQGQERFSVPFFFEPRPNTVIAPLGLPGGKDFQPFLYGDHLWATTTKFPENLGLGHLRPPRAAYVDPLAD